MSERLAVRPIGLPTLAHFLRKKYQYLIPTRKRLSFIIDQIKIYQRIDRRIKRERKGGKGEREREKKEKRKREGEGRGGEGEGEEGTT